MNSSLSRSSRASPGLHLGPSNNEHLHSLDHNTSLQRRMSVTPAARKVDSPRTSNQTDDTCTFHSMRVASITPTARLQGTSPIEAEFNCTNGFDRTSSHSSGISDSRSEAIKAPNPSTEEGQHVDIQCDSEGTVSSRENNSDDEIDWSQPGSQGYRSFRLSHPKARREPKVIPNRGRSFRLKRSEQLCKLYIVLWLLIYLFPPIRSGMHNVLYIIIISKVIH